VTVEERGPGLALKINSGPSIGHPAAAWVALAVLPLPKAIEDEHCKLAKSLVVRKGKPVCFS